MRTISLPDDKLREVLAALDQSRGSEHRRDCGVRRRPAKDCTCHVARAVAAFNIFRQAARQVLVRAENLRVDQWLTTAEDPLPRCIVSVQLTGSIRPRVFVRVAYEDSSGRRIEALTFNSDEEVTTIDPTF